MILVLPGGGLDSDGPLVVPISVVTATAVGMPLGGRGYTGSPDFTWRSVLAISFDAGVVCSTPRESAVDISVQPLTPTKHSIVMDKSFGFPVMSTVPVIDMATTWLLGMSPFQFAFRIMYVKSFAPVPAKTPLFGWNKYISMIMTLYIYINKWPLPRKRAVHEDLRKHILKENVISINYRKPCTGICPLQIFSKVTSVCYC